AAFLEPADSSWREDAACQHADPDIFYPEPGDADTAARAVAVCGTCPVTEACLTDALHTREQFGIRGGLTPRQRIPLFAGRHRTIHHTGAKRTPVAARDRVRPSTRGDDRQRVASGRTR